MRAAIVNRSIPRLPAEKVGLLARLSSAVVCDVLGGDRVLDSSIGPVGDGRRVAGQAVTVHNGPGSNLGVHVALEVAGPGDVIVLSPSSPGDAAYGLWGGIANSCGLARALGGVVADGFVRDTRAIRHAGLPVWARGSDPRSGTKDRLVGVNVDVLCGGVLVRPGDVVVADDDGIAVVRIEDVDDVLDDGLRRLRWEEEMTHRVGRGEATTFTALGLDSLVADGRLEFVGTTSPEGHHA
ncbi:MAG: RraA family protein [Pseudonocardia sp.]